MIEVELPDGSIAEFPDGTSHDVIKGALRKRFGAPAAPASASPELQSGLSELSALTQEAGRGQREISEKADKIDQAGTGLFKDMTASGMANAIPFADELYSALSAVPSAAVSALQGEGFDPDAEYAKSQALNKELERRRVERHPIGTTIGNIAGGIGATAPLSGGGLSFLKGAKPTLARISGSCAAEGATYGAVYGAGEGDGFFDRAWNATKGAAGGTVAGALFGGLARIGASKYDAALPTGDDLEAAAQAAYKRAEDAGVVYSKSAIRRVADALKETFENSGYDPDLPMAGAKAALGKIERMADENATLRQLDNAYKVANNGFVPGLKTNNKLSAKVASAIDDMVSNPQAGDVIEGAGEAAGAALKEARGLWRQSSKLKEVDRLLDRAGRKAGASNSGTNVDNATRQQLNKILDSEKLKRGYTQAELKAMRTAVMGSKSQNVLRALGNWSKGLGGHSVAAGSVGASLATGNPLPLVAVAAPYLVGGGLKAASNSIGRANQRVIEALIASGGKLPGKSVGSLNRVIAEALSRGSGQLSPRLLENTSR